MSIWYGATICLGEHLAPPFKQLFYHSHSIVVSRASLEYISERLDGSTHWWFTMPQCPDSLNHRLNWTSSFTVTCEPFACITKRGCIFRTTGSSLLPLPGLGSPLASPTIPGKGGILTGSPLNARPETQSKAMPMMLSNMQRILRRATPSSRTMRTPRAKCAASEVFFQRCTMTPDY